MKKDSTERSLTGIVVINQDSGYLMIDILNALSKKGMKASLVTGRLIVRAKPLSENVSVKRIIHYKRN